MRIASFRVLHFAATVRLTPPQTAGCYMERFGRGNGAGSPVDESRPPPTALTL
jgi:hypothetical protein